jgi:arylsulfatase A-like enzyme
VLDNGLRADPPGHPGAQAAFAQALQRAPDVRFEAAIAQSVSTYVSLGSVLTGRYPTAIPLCAWGLGAQEPPWCTRFPDGAPSLPEILAIYGYDTALVVVPPRVREHDQLAGEFDEVVVAAANGVADGVTRALDWWKAHAGHRRLLVLTANAAAPLAALAPPGAPSQAMDAATRARVLVAYENVARAHGEALAPLLDAVLAAGPRPAAVLVGSAHGVNLGETTGTASLPLLPIHHDILLERTLRVPLSLYTSAAGPTRVVGDVVELVDVLPTFARLAGVMPPAALAGHDLLGASDPERVGYAEFGDMIAVRSRTHLLLARLWMHGGTTLDPEISRRLIEAPEGRTSFALHDVASDPLQEHELLEEQAALAHTLYERMVALRQGPGAPPDRGFTEEQVQALRGSGSQSYF